MKKTIVWTALFAISVVSCKEEKHKHDIEVKVVDENMSSATPKLDVKVENRLDPICEMETIEHLSDTILYNGKVYGFCSSGCKETFAKNPDLYLSKMK